MLAEASMGAFATIAVTYLKKELDASGMLINGTILILLVTSLPAAVLGRYAMDKWSPYRMVCASTSYMIVVTFIAPLFIRGGNDKTRAMGQMMVPVFAFLWGIGFGGWVS